MKLKKYIGCIMAYIVMTSCSEEKTKEKQGHDNINDIVLTDTVMNENTSQIIKDIKGINLDYPEFLISGYKTEAKFVNGKFKTLISFIEEEGKLVKNRAVIINDLNGKDKQEIKTYFDYNPEKTDTLNFTPLKSNIFRAKTGGVAWDIEIDTSGRVLSRIGYTGDDAEFVNYYYRVLRNNLGDEQQSILVQGDSDAEVRRVIYEYLSFDKNGNWTKRKKRIYSGMVDWDDFQEYFDGKKKNISLDFPVNGSGTPEELIEEREISYE